MDQWNIPYGESCASYSLRLLGKVNATITSVGHLQFICKLELTLLAEVE